MSAPVAPGTVKFSIQLNSCGRFFGQISTILLALIGIAVISFSLHHDRVWNIWVDNEFNLNLENPSFRDNVADFTDVRSQQEWIDLVKRETMFDRGYLLLHAFVAIITTFYALTCANTRANFILGGMTYFLCCIVLLCAGGMLTASLIQNEGEEILVANMVLNLTGTSNSQKSTSAPTSEMEELGHDLQRDIFCHTVDHKTSILRHCQMYSIKVAAIITAFANSLISAYLMVVLLTSAPNPFNGPLDLQTFLSPTEAGPKNTSPANNPNLRPSADAATTTTTDQRSGGKAFDKKFGQEDLNEAVQTLKRAFRGSNSAIPIRHDGNGKPMGMTYGILGTNEEQWKNVDSRQNDGGGRVRGTKYTYPAYQPQIGSNNNE